MSHSAAGCPHERYLTTLSARREIWISDIGPATASIMQRIAGLPEPQSDEAVAAVDRVVLAIEVTGSAPRPHPRQLLTKITKNG